VPNCCRGVGPIEVYRLHQSLGTASGPTFYLTFSIDFVHVSLPGVDFSFKDACGKEKKQLDFPTGFWSYSFQAVVKTISGKPNIAGRNDDAAMCLVPSDSGLIVA